jgi:HK97 family phage portal protein
LRLHRKALLPIWPFTLLEKKQITLDVDLASLLNGVQTAAGISVSTEQALRVPAVAAAIRTISEAAASLDVGVVEIAADRRETKVTGHPAAVLLSDDSNEWTSGFELIRALVVDALTIDNGALAWVNWRGDEPREIIHYKRGVIAADLSLETREPIYRINGARVDAQSIIHVRGAFDKCSVSLAREAIGVALAMERHAGNLFGQGARPGGVISTPKAVGDAGIKKMLEGWRAAHEGPSASGRTAILWDGAEWKQSAMSSVDAQFQELRLFQLQEIARAFNIPASMLGDLTRATWSNSAEMQKQFLMLCLEPWLRALESAFRRALFKPEDRKKYAVRFERDDFSKVDLSALATAVNSLIASRVLNPNTARSWLGLPDYEGGNEYANPNTGASQPNAPSNSNNEIAKLRREIEALKNAA